MPGLEPMIFITLIAGVVAYGVWRERQDDKNGRKHNNDGTSYPIDSGASWFGGSDSGCGGGDCGTSDSGGSCGGDGGGGGGD